MSIGIDNLKQIVVLMMENRSFDHMLGFAQSDGWPIDGLTGTESNKDSAGADVQASQGAGFAGDFTPDPGHSVFDTLTQLYTDPRSPIATDPTMSGFVRSYEGKTGDPADAHRIMRCFSPGSLPVLTSLAKQFCVCNRWFSSVPGPTFPNRAFVHGATSIGHVDMRIDWHDMTTTIYERLAQNKVDSVIYYHDSTMAITFNGLAGKNDFFGSVVDDFFPACENDDLPPYSFIEPRFANSAGGNGEPAFAASDQHPDHDVREGEALIHRVFQAIWSKPKIRNKTLLVIIYDEHGGLYDHVKPPTTVNPDGKVWTNDGISLDPSFDFSRLGVRVPAVLISPYIAPGTIDPTIYDHSSVIATARKLLIPNVANSHLTLRDKNANTFEHNLTLAQARTDNIDFGAAIQSQPPTNAQLALTINEHLQAHVRVADMLEQTRLRPGQPPRFTDSQIQRMNEAQASAYLREVHTKLGALAKQSAAGGRN